MTEDTIGIDISKDTLDAHRLSTGETAQFPNSPAGLRTLRRWIGAKMPDLAVFEATGAYHAPLERSFAGVLPLVKVRMRSTRLFRLFLLFLPCAVDLVAKRGASAGSVTGQPIQSLPV